MKTTQNRIPYYQAENWGKVYECRCGWHDNYRVREHLHRFSEFLYVESGEITVYLNGESLAVTAGHSVMILPHEVHAYGGETHSRALCVVCSNDYIPCFFDRLGERIPATRLFDARGVAETFCALPFTPAEDNVRFMGLLNMVCAAFLEQTVLVAQHAADRSLYREALDYIERHFRTNVTLHSVAKALGCHEKYLSRLLNDTTGMHFRTFLNSRRVEYACTMLRGPYREDATIAAVAHEAGFSSINTFNRVFKQFCGATPYEYRRG